MPIRYEVEHLLNGAMDLYRSLYPHRCTRTPTGPAPLQPFQPGDTV
jgi:hypothetical protein